MNKRSIIGILMIFLLLQYSFGGLYASGVSINNSGMNNSIAISNNTTIKIINDTSLNILNSTTSNYQTYPLNCPNWDSYKNKHLSPITNFVDYRDDLNTYVKSFINTDNYNIQKSKANYENKSGYFSGNPICGDVDYRYMSTSELNEAHSSASIAKSRIIIANSLSTSLQATYTIAAVVLGAASGICGICTTIAGVLTASTAGAISPILVVFIVITGMVVATTIAIGVCTGVVADASSDINVEQGKIDNRLTIMNAELTYRSTLPQNSKLMATPLVVLNKTNNTQNASENNQTQNNNTTNLNTTTNLNITTNLNSITDFNTTTGFNNTTVPNNTTNTTNTTISEGNVYGVNDVQPSNEPIPSNVSFKRSGTYMDMIYGIDLSSFPQEPSKPHPKWYQFWLWVDYGFKYTAWSFDVVGWGLSHLDSLNNLISICEHIQSDYKILN